MKFKGLQWAGNVAKKAEERRNTYRILVWKSLKTATCKT
jgi:hypothetical protein